MWQIIVFSVILLGVHQLWSTDDTPMEPSMTVVMPTSSPPPRTTAKIRNVTVTAIPGLFGLTTPVPPSRSPTAPAKGAMTTATSPTANKSVPNPNVYTYMDAVTGKVYEIPKLGSCVPCNGYKRFLNPATGSAEFTNLGPIEFRMYNLTLLHYGFTWRGAPLESDVLTGINKSEVAKSIRAEINGKLEQLWSNSHTTFDWRTLKDQTQQWPKWPLDKTSEGRALISVSAQRTLYTFQLLFKCGEFTLYTEQLHWVEFSNGKCETGEYAFETCSVCADITGECPLVIEN